METFTGYEYLLIDIANNSNTDMDKELYQTRIKWTTDNLDNLELLAEDEVWKERPLYLVSVHALREVQAGNPTGYLVGFDAVNSGIQLMACLTKDVKAAKLTGLVDTDRRADAYTETTLYMNSLLDANHQYPRKQVKEALVPAIYGSTAEPKKLFGEDTPELWAFYTSMQENMPGIVMLLELLIASWNGENDYHSYMLPDNTEVAVPNIITVTEDLLIEELEYTCDFSYTTKNTGTSVANAANVVQSVDALVLREVIRRTNYDVDRVEYLHDEITYILIADSNKVNPNNIHHRLYMQSNLVCMNILTEEVVLDELSTEHLKAIQAVLTLMVSYTPFEMLTIHDDYKCHPNNMNYVRDVYRNILADIVDSTLIESILNQLYGMEGNITKGKLDSTTVRNSNYALT